MKCKRIMLFGSILLAVLMIGAVSAADENQTSDNLTVVEELIVESCDDEVLSMDVSIGTFSDLSDRIESASDGDVLELDIDYQNYGSVSEQGITISKSLTIDGKGHSLDADGKSRIFNIDADNVILRDIVFKNGACDMGGAICWNGENGVVRDCSFVNCVAGSGGGAIYWNEVFSDECDVFNCSFVNCAADDGGAIYSTDVENIAVCDCSFVNCSADYGGAIEWCGAINPVVSGCSFAVCSAAYNGGAIYYYDEISVSNCSFVNCTADNGGAVYCGGGSIRDSFFNGNFAFNESNIFNTGEMVLENNVFDVIGGNSSNPGNLSPTSFLDLQTLVNGAEEGGVIELSGNQVNGSGTEINIDKSLTINGNGTTLDAKELSLVFHITADNVVLSNINFVNCYSGLGAGGGAIYWKGTNGRLVNCTFINCKSITACGGAVYLNGSYASVEDCSFVNCSAINTYQNLYYYALGVSSYGGAIFLSSYAENCSVKNCNFINSTVRASAYSEDIRGVSSDTSSYGHGGAVYWAGDNGCLMDCSFENSFADADSISGHSTLHSYSTAHSYGGAVFWSGNEGSISNCSFENSNAEASAVAGYGSNSFGSSTYSHGGALYLTGSSNHVSDCRFVNCSVDAKSGCVNIVDGGVSWDVNLSSPVHSINSSGGAICFDEDCNGNVVGCSFIDCSSNGDYNHVVVNAKSIVDCIFNPIDNSTLDVGGENTTDTNITDVTGDKTTNATGNATNGNAADTNTTDATGNDTSNTTKPTPEMVVPPLDKPSSDGSVIISLPGDATGKVTLTINGKDYDYDIENGIVNVIIPNLRDGNYPYTITYSGDSKYSSLTNNGSLKVNNTSVNPVENQTNSTVNPDNKTETTENNTSQENMPVIDNSKIVASNVNVVYSAGSYYTITVYGTDGKPANTVVKITGKISKTLTATNGIAKFKIDQVPGTYKITITALGKSVSKTITVKHLVSLKTVKVKKSAKKLVLQATLGKINGKYLKNKKITFKFNGKKFTAKTNKRGVAKVTIKSKVLKKLKVGKKVTYQATYLKDTVKKIVKIKK